MTLRAYLWAVVFALASCGGAISEPLLTQDAGRRKDAGRDVATQDIEMSVQEAGPDAAADSYPVYIEDACADAPLEMPPLECDPFSPRPCGPGEGCYPIPPRGTDRCHPGRFGTACLPAGDGQQGSPCGGGTDCASGYMCVKTGAGDQCVKLCRLTDLNGCNDGRICREVDVTGSEWGGCE